MQKDLQTIVAWAKRRGFVYPGSDIYGGLANAWDFGPYGTILKKNIADLWRKEFVQKRADIIPLDAAILMNSKVWEASGHVANFNDPMIDDKNTGERFRVDKLIEEKLEKRKNALNPEYVKNILKKYEKELQKIGNKMNTIEENIDALLGALEYYKSSLNNKISQNIINQLKQEYLNLIKKPLKETNKQLKHKKDIIKFLGEFIDRYINGGPESALLLLLNKGIGVTNLIPESWTFQQMKAFVDKYIEDNPNTGKKANWTDVRKFNLMFKTHQGVIEDDSTVVYLRPETAQGIFVNFKNILDTMRVRLPFGIAQIGKAFRNEITPGNFLYRVREFEQMEIEYFVEPENDEPYFEQWKQDSMKRWTEVIGIKPENLRFRDHEEDELSHYSKGTTDIEYRFPWGWGELQGIARRTDYDLRQHQSFSGENLQYTDPKTGKRFIPWVIEPSWGLTRAVLTAMIDAYDEEEYLDPKGRKQTRVVARFHPNIAPIKFAILPLLEKNEEMVSIAQDIFKELSQEYMVELDIKGNIGKRYRRQDEIGTPYCITIDHQTLEDGTVTIRDRDTMEQKRVKIGEIKGVM